MTDEPQAPPGIQTIADFLVLLGQLLIETGKMQASLGLVVAETHQRGEALVAILQDRHLVTEGELQAKVQALKDVAARAQEMNKKPE